MRRFKLVLVLLAFVLAALQPCLSAAAETIRIGEINPLTGKLSKHGLEIHEGILCAVEEIQDRGGIHGRRVQLVSRDDQSLPEVAVHQTEDLLYREKVVGLVGGYVDSLVGPISELAAKQRIPFVASASLQSSLTRKRQNAYFFRVSKLSGIVGPLCEFTNRVLKPERVAVLVAATPGSTELGQEVRECLEGAGIEVLPYEKFRPGTPDFSGFLMKLRTHAPGVLVSGGFFPDHLILVRQLKEQKIPLKAYIAPWGVTYTSFIEELGAASEGLVGLCAWHPGLSLPGTEAESEAFVKRFVDRFGKMPTTTTMHGYTSARALLAAIEKAVDKKTDLSGEAIAEQLRSLDLQLPMERLVFDANGDPMHYEQMVVQIQQGKMVAVYPPARATGSFSSR